MIYCRTIVHATLGSDKGKKGFYNYGKKSVRFVCTACNPASSTWAGRCPTAAEWNTLRSSNSYSLAAATDKGSVLKPQPVATRGKQAEARMPSWYSRGRRCLGRRLGARVVTSWLASRNRQVHVADANRRGFGRQDQICYVSGEESAWVAARRLGWVHLKRTLQLVTSNSADDIASHHCQRQLSSGNWTPFRRWRHRLWPLAPAAWLRLPIAHSS